MSKDLTIQDILQENERRKAQINTLFNPITGFNSVGERKEFVLDDFPLRVQYLPVAMLNVPLVRKLKRYGSIDAFLHSIGSLSENRKSDREKVIEQFVRVRYKYDFPFWAASLVFIKNKGGGEDVLFRLTRPQRKLVEKLEALRNDNKPIRIVLLKARQWGGSTTVQIYMAWLQLVHKVGLNSLIIAHVSSTSDEIKDMFDRMIKEYPAKFLHDIGQAYNDDEPKLVGVGRSGNIFRVPQRNCKIKIGTAENPGASRGGDYNLVHLSEVAKWPDTTKKTAEEIVRSACAGIAYAPYTMIIYESTANGTGNFFQKEYDDAKRRRSNFEAVFVSWYEIDLYSLPIDDIEAFAKQLFEQRNSETTPTTREEPGKYLWWLWEQGATLEAINWYINERAAFTEHSQMASEYPSDDIEAFVHSGARVFDRYKVEQMKTTCKPPKYIGEVYADADNGDNALKNIRFGQDTQGSLFVWDLPEKDDKEEVTQRYLAVVDIGGVSNKSDWSVILIIDRLFMVEGGKPSIVAQWYGHIDMDLLAWKAVQVASFYNNALLVIESNTLETHDRDRDVDGDQSQFILNQIKYVYSNLYARKQSEEDIIEGRPKKYGFHTNVATKPMIISTLRKAVREGMYIERDERCLEEYLYYEKKPNGSFGAIPGKHDDLLMTRAIGLHICFYEMDVPKVVSRHSQHNTTNKPILSAATI